MAQFRAEFPVVQVMKKGLTIKIHEHVNDEILSYVSSGVMHHKDSADFDAPIARGKLMLMNAGESFWHEEKVTEMKGTISGLKK